MGCWLALDARGAEVGPWIRGPLVQLDCGL